MLYSTLFRRGIDGVSVTRIERDPSNRENEKLKRNVLIEKQSNIDIYMYVKIRNYSVEKNWPNLLQIINDIRLKREFWKLFFDIIFLIKNYNIKENMKKHKTYIYIYICINMIIYEHM